MIPFDDDATFPLMASPGFTCSIKFDRRIIKRRDGTEVRVANKRHPIRTWNVSPLIRTQAQFMAVVEFFVSRGGSARAFRFRDWFDYTSAVDNVGEPAADDQTIVSEGGEYRLYKDYTFEGYTYSRRIFKPVADSFVSGDATLTDASRGLVSGPGKAGFAFDVPARFSPDNDNLTSISWDDFQAGSVQITVEEIPMYDLSANSMVAGDPPDTPTGGVKNPTTGSGTGGGGSASGGGGSGGGGGKSPTGIDPPVDASCSKCGDCCFSSNATADIEITGTSDTPVNGTGQFTMDLSSVPRTDSCTFSANNSTSGVTANVSNGSTVADWSCTAVYSDGIWTVTADINGASYIDPISSECSDAESNNGTCGEANKSGSCPYGVTYLWSVRIKSNPCCKRADGQCGGQKGDSAGNCIMAP